MQDVFNHLSESWQAVVGWQNRWNWVTCLLSYSRLVENSSYSSYIISRTAKEASQNLEIFFFFNSGGITFLVFHWPKNFEDIVKVPLWKETIKVYTCKKKKKSSEHMNVNNPQQCSPSWFVLSKIKISILGTTAIKCLIQPWHNQFRISCFKIVCRDGFSDVSPNDL